MAVVVILMMTTEMMTVMATMTIMLTMVMIMFKIMMLVRMMIMRRMSDQFLSENQLVSLATSTLEHVRHLAARSCKDWLA